MEFAVSDATELTGYVGPLRHRRGLRAVPHDVRRGQRPLRGRAAPGDPAGRPLSRPAQPRHVTTTTIRGDITVAAPPPLLYDLIARVDRAPQFFAPHLYASVSGDVVRRWVLAGDTVRSWTARRELDPDGLRITFEHLEPAPLTAMAGEWTFEPTSAGTVVRLAHTFAGASAERTADVARNTTAQLDHVKRIAENFSSLSARTVHASGSVAVTGSLEDVQRRLVESGWAAAVVAPDVLALKWTGSRDRRFHAVTAVARLAGTTLDVECTVTAAEDSLVSAVRRWLPTAIRG
ncbi:SRPBCC family protein [Kutzneria kofuensis]|uniref:SRPBCC family protein n=1 Tax=Kutzneria kofuensis TaxID=103725 RepID=UPI0028A91B2B|nr:SRPBCC family protein [Kutzneria kofuensis]